MIEDNWDKKSGKTIRIDGELIYEAKDLKVGLFDNPSAL